MVSSIENFGSYKDKWIAKQPLYQWSAFLSVSLATLLAYSLIRSAYLLYFHPLSQFPGPRAAKLSKRWVRKLHPMPEEEFERLHQKYRKWTFLQILICCIANQNCLSECDAIRVAPNELHLTDPNLYKVIYAQTGEFRKYTSFYAAFNLAHTVFGEDDPTKHKIRRRMLSLYFSQKAVVGIQPLILEALANVSQRLAKRDLTRPINIYGLARSLTTDLITAYSFAHSVGTLQSCDEDFTPHNSITDTFDAAALFTLARAYQPTFRWLQDHIPQVLAERLSPTAKAVKGYNVECARILQAYKNNTNKGTNPIIFDGLVDVPETQMVTEAANIIAAGSDTTAFTLAYACYQLCRNADIMKRLVTEVDAAYRASSDRHLTLVELESIPYLNAVVKEVVRAAHAIPGRLPRVVPSNLKVPLVVDGKVVPAGTVVGMSAYTMHRNKEVWGEDAAIFNPDRWLGEDSKRLMNNMVTFSKGNRGCIGQNLALAELHHVLAYLTHEFDMSLAEETKEMHVFDAFTTQMEPVWLHLKNRTSL